MMIWIAWTLLADAVTPSLNVKHEAVNEVAIVREGQRLAVYSAGRARVERILYTHARRDAFVPAAGAESTVPEKEATLFRDPASFWNAFTKERYHDYEARASKWPLRPLTGAIATAKGGDRIIWRGLTVDVVDTPGYTPGAVSYVMNVDGQTVAFTGDLIYGDGQLLDIYSLQAAVPETKTRGYHGFGARAADLLLSLRRIAARKPTLIIPARGPVIRNPAAALAKLEDRITRLFAEHFSTDALRWYWGDDNLRTRAGKILGPRPLDWIEMSEQRALPDWVVAIQNSRLILSASGAAYLIDCGNPRILAEVQKRAPRLDGIFITHYHDDHTDHAQAAAAAYNTRVHASPELADVLRNPRAYRLPAMTANPITSLDVMPEGKTVRWHEFELTYLYYPGQTLYHGGLLVKKDGAPEPLFFVGDTFTPSGIDDYCLQNRNLLEADQGYLYCLRKLREMKSQPWLINQHVAPMFRFTPAFIARVEQSLARRTAILRELTPFDHPNYAVDEQWAWFEPYGASARPGATVELKLRVTNHAAAERTFRVDGRAVKLAARQSAAVPVKVRVPQDAGPVWMTAVSLEAGGLRLREWAEAMISTR